MPANVTLQWHQMNFSHLALTDSIFTWHHLIYLLVSTTQQSMYGPFIFPRQMTALSSDTKQRTLHLPMITPKSLLL